MIPRDLTAREDLNLNHNIKITFIKGLWITVGIVKMSLVATVMSVSFFILSYGCVCVCVYISHTGLCNMYHDATVLYQCFTMTFISQY